MVSFPFLWSASEYCFSVQYVGRVSSLSHKHFGQDYWRWIHTNYLSKQTKSLQTTYVPVMLIMLFLLGTAFEIVFCGSSQ